MNWLLGSVASAGLLAAGPGLAADVTERVSSAVGGVQANGHSFDATLSADGRLVAFSSDATNLVPADTNFIRDVFVRDRQAGKTERISLGAGGAQGNLFSYEAEISADGRFVVFTSGASNLVPADTNARSDIFVRDRQRGMTERVSVGAGNIQSNGFSYHAAISADGRFVAFESDATNLVGGDTNLRRDVFVRDRQTGRTERVNLGPGGAQSVDGHSDGVALSPDGRFVAFVSGATNLVAKDGNGSEDIFVRDRTSGITERVSVGSRGVQANGRSDFPSVSADGRFIAFESVAGNLVPGDTNKAYDAFVRDRKTGTTERISVGPGGVQGNSDSSVPRISADGRFVYFQSDASNLVAGDTNGKMDLFVRDRKSGVTKRVSLSSAGAQGNSDSQVPALSADGRSLGFYSDSSNLVPGDTNGFLDVFVHSAAP